MAQKKNVGADGPEGWLVGIIERCMDVLERYSIFKLLKLALVFIIGAYVFWIGTNQDKVLENFFNKKDAEHTQLMEYRKEIAPQIKVTLNQLLLDLNMDRAFVLEFHNGKENPAGLPFHYAEMSYEEVKDGVIYIGDDYDNLNLSRFSFPDYLYKQKIWVGSIDSLMKIDERVALRLKSNDVTYVGLILLRDSEQELGFLGVTSVNPNASYARQAIIRELVDKGQIVSSKLSIPKYIREKE